MNQIALINFNQKSHGEFSALLEQHDYEVIKASTPELLAESMGDGLMLAVIVDIDENPAVKEQIKTVATQMPAVKIFCISERKLHPELEEVISRYVYACLNKPIEVSELFYLLQSVAKDQRINGIKKV